LRPGIAVGRLDVWNWHARKRATTALAELQDQFSVVRA